MRLPMVVVAVALGVSACSGSSPTAATPSSASTTPAAVTVTSVTISGSAPAVGLTAQFAASATLSNGTTQAVTALATWQTSNTSVATVSSAGLVTGMGLGVADLRASYQGATGLQTLTIATVAPGKLAISTTAGQGWSSIAVSVNGSSIGTLTQFGQPNGGVGSCAAVSGARLVATVQAGTATYTARSNAGTTWSGSAQVPPTGCVEVQLTCPNGNCSPAPGVPPPPVVPPPPGVPSYQGQWTGSARVLNCAAVGQFLVLTPPFCTVFAVGTLIPMSLSLTQNGTSVNGTLAPVFGAVGGAVSLSGSVGSGGALVLAGGNSSAVGSVTISGFVAGVNGSSMSGYWEDTATLTDAGLTGSGAFQVAFVVSR